MEAKWRIQRPRKQREEYKNTIETQCSQIITEYDHQEGWPNGIDVNTAIQQREWMHLRGRCIWGVMHFRGWSFLGVDASTPVIYVYFRIRCAERLSDKSECLPNSSNSNLSKFRPFFNSQLLKSLTFFKSQPFQILASLESWLQILNSIKSWLKIPTFFKS